MQYKLLHSICFLTVFSIFLSACSSTSQPTVTPTPSNSTIAPTTQTTPQVSAWPIADPKAFLPFSTDKIAFSFPPQLKMSTGEGKITLYHSIAHKHPDHCDFQGSGKMLDELADFNLTFQVNATDLRGTLESRAETYLVEQMQGNGFVVEKGFIDSVDVGKYKGFKVLSGVEGCGNIVYYVPVSAQRTLVIERALVPELAPINSEFEKNRQLPGVIQPEQETAWVESILKSVKVF